MNFDWQDVAFGSKKSINELDAIFIAAPRQLSKKRFTELIKIYLPTGNILLGLAKGAYITGFDKQSQFQTLQLKDVQSVITKIAASKSKHKVYTLSYQQRELDFILDKLRLRRVVLVNGSWQYVFHASSSYYKLMNGGIPHDMVSPFVSEAEAREYEIKHSAKLRIKPGLYSDEEMMTLADEVATQSYDYSFQTGLTMGKKSGKKYRYLLSAFNRVVPYQTYALHHGNLREKNFSPANDLNYYDTIHAETLAILEAGQKGLKLKGQTMFVNLLPCPTCARLLAASDITELVYQIDHSAGYAVQLLEAAGKQVRRLVL
jgi:deoxycytidylate deaminase